MNWILRSTLLLGNLCYLFTRDLLKTALSFSCVVQILWPWTSAFPGQILHKSDENCLMGYSLPYKVVSQLTILARSSSKTISLGIKKFSLYIHLPTHTHTYTRLTEKEGNKRQSFWILSVIHTAFKWWPLKLEIKRRELRLSGPERYKKIHFCSCLLAGESCWLTYNLDKRFHLGFSYGVPQVFLYLYMAH